MHLSSDLEPLISQTLQPRLMLRTCSCTAVSQGLPSWVLSVHGMEPESLFEARRNHTSLEDVQKQDDACGSTWIFADLVRAWQVQLEDNAMSVQTRMSLQPPSTSEPSECNLFRLDQSCTLVL